MARAKILVVDDNWQFSENLYDILHEKGYDVDVTYSASQAVETIKKTEFDVVLMDIKMPLMDGVEVISVIKDACPSTAVIIMSAYSVEELVDRGLKEGAAAFLRKPLDIGKLIEQIELVKG